MFSMENQFEHEYMRPPEFATMTLVKPDNFESSSADGYMQSSHLAPKRLLEVDDTDASSKKFKLSPAPRSLIEHVAEQFSTFEEENNTLRIQVSEQAIQLSEYQKKSVEVERELEELRPLAKSADQLQQLREQFKSLQDEHESLRQDVEKHQKTASTDYERMITLNKEIKELEKEKKALKDEERNLQTNLSTQRRTNQEQSATICNLRNDLSKAKRDLNHQALKIDCLEEQVAVLFTDHCYSEEVVRRAERLGAQLRNTREFIQRRRPESGNDDLERHGEELLRRLVDERSDAKVPERGRRR